MDGYSETVMSLPMLSTFLLKYGLGRAHTIAVRVLYEDYSSASQILDEVNQTTWQANSIPGSLSRHTKPDGPSPTSVYGWLRELRRYVA